MHDNNIVHGNLKPGNILVSIPQGSKDGRPVMKLSGFGMSRIVPDFESHLIRNLTKEMSRPFGTRRWVAPEILYNQRTYTEKIDIYPLGFIFAFTLSDGCQPYGKNLRTTNVQGEPILTVAQLKETYPDAFKLIQLMLSADPQKRPSAAQLLKHEHFLMQVSKNG